jgi:hypothetical protein
VWYVPVFALGVELKAQVVVPAALQRNRLVPAPHVPRSFAPENRNDAESHGAHVALVAAGALAAATGNQIIASPKGWPRTWRGYASRVGDQVAFAVVEEGVRLAVDATVDWEPDTLPCVPSRDAASRLEPGLLRRAGCAVRQTAVMRTPAGAARPNLPVATGVVLASVASVSWRPEGKDPVKARALVATRIAVVFGASAATKMVTTWWRDRTVNRETR